MLSGSRGRRWYRETLVYIRRVIFRLFHISRPVLWVNTVGPATVGMWLAGDLWRWEALPVLLWLTLPFNLLIYGVNDVFEDRKSVV